MKDHLITTDDVVAFNQCKRKAYLLLRGHPRGIQHDYEDILLQRAALIRERQVRLVDRSASARTRIENGTQQIAVGDLKAACDVMVQRNRRSPNEHVPYEPLMIVGTYSVTAEQKVSLAFAGHVIGEWRRYRPKTGYIITYGEKRQRVHLEPLYATVQSSVHELRDMKDKGNSAAPPLVLNKHCSICPFRCYCLREAEKEDNLSLLERMTPKLMLKYHRKGIFTVNQLSYVFTPRRRRKQTKKAVLTFNVELQALAMRTNKTYLNEIPSLPEHPVEIYLDIEGIPDQQFDYLIGVLIRDENGTTPHSFWADSPLQEKGIFQNCVDLVAAYGNTSVYHYGSYEPRAFARAVKKHHISLGSLESHLVNVNRFVFGKAYFPARSNRLKDLGSLIGATWDSKSASGIQSLVWRYRWEETRNDELKNRLIRYNLADCNAVRLLTVTLRDIAQFADSRADVEFADFPKLQSTDRGSDIHRSFEGILASAHATYRQHRIRIRRSNDRSRTTGGKCGAPTGHPGYIRTVPKNPSKTVRVRRRMRCPQRHHKGDPLRPTDETAEHTVIDLAFTKSGCRKTVTKLVGTKSYCPRCHRDYLPPAISRLGNHLFGHGFQAWAVYQRIALRLPYAAITRTADDLFSEQVTAATIVNFVRNMSTHYASTEKLLLKRILASPFLHVDETRLSIRGEQNYVWVLTDGTHVVFRLTETREAPVIEELLTGYEGVLVADFYGGYDSIACRQQKCLSHLIRDLNDDLWKNPFNHQFELFVSAIRDLLVPIFKDVDKYGLKARNLRKHTRDVQRFYASFVGDRTYECDLIAKYQKRFIRYRDSMFLFLEEDGIPWNNNAAERAIRHLAVQRKISGSFYRQTAVEYLRLLGIGQTCRFQNKSFLRFLVSGGNDVDAYLERKRKPSSMRVIKPEQL